MKCAKCGNEMMIYSEFTEPVEDGGELVVDSVVDLLCTDPQCPDGARGLPTARLRRRIRNKTNMENALSCCGAPLAYYTQSDYHIPDEKAIVSQEENVLLLRCDVCGARHELVITGKTKV